MFNKSFFMGVLTTLAAVVILAAGALVAVRAFQPGINAGFMAGGRPGGFEQRGGNWQFQPGGPGSQGAPGQGDQRFGHRGGGNFNNEGRPGQAFAAAPLRGIAGVLGSLFLIGLIVAAVVGGSRLFKRFRGRPAPPPAPVAPAEESFEEMSVVETAEDPGVERPAVLPEESIEPGDNPDEPPAGELR